MSRPRILTTTPLLVVSDLQRSIDFYREKLGFSGLTLAGDPPSFAMLDRDGFELMLSLGRLPGRIHPNGSSGVWDVYVRVVDVGAEGSALIAAGVPIDKGPTDTPYEMREIEVLDPDGHRWCFGQDIGPAGSVAWEGILDIGSAKLRLVLKLSVAADGTWRGSLDSLDQRAMNLPIDSVIRDGSSLHFEMKAIRSSFEGVLSQDGSAFSGTWSQAGHQWPLVFHKRGS